MSELPLPIAVMLRRAHNAKSAKEQHDSAFYAWEASVRLVAALTPPDAAALGAPSLGHFVAAVSWSRQACDDGRLRAVLAWLSEHAGAGAAGRTVAAHRLMPLLPPYRNRVLGHGSVRPARFYEEGAALLGAGLAAAWSAGFFLAPAEELVWVESVALGPASERRGRVLVLSGLAPRLEPAASRSLSPSAVPETLMVRREGDHRPVEPLCVFDPTELRERVLFLNGYRRRPRYLDYLSGEELEGAALAAACPHAEARFRAFAAGAASAPAEDEARTNDDATRVGDYELLGKLGEGGMGVVYLARQRSLGRLVALKMLPSGAAEDKVAVARFDREARALGRCDHPNVVKILSTGNDRGRPYYVMELVDGPDLGAVAGALSRTDSVAEAVSDAAAELRSGRAEAFAHLPELGPSAAPPSLERAGRWQALGTLLRDASQAVDYLHRQGVVHRDLKPANLMVTTAGHRVVVMDLGLAMLGDASRTLTADAGTLLGTLRYMAPEQLQRKLLEVDQRADVYSLGASFYELCTGRPMLTGETDAQLVHQLLYERPAPPRTVCPDLPADLSTILQKATEKDPERRYPSAAALAADAAAFLEGRPIAARAPTLGYVLTLAIKRRRALFGAIVAALVAMVVATLAYVSRERELRARAEEARRQAEQASDEARRARDEVERRETELLEQHGRRELLGGQPARAAVLLSEAYRRAPTNTALAMLVTEALERGVAPFVALAGHTGAVTSVRFSPGGARAVTASEDGTVRVWDSYTGRLLHRLDPDSPVLVVRWWGPRHLMGLDARQRLWVAALEPRPRLLGPLDRATWERAVREAVDLEPPLPWRARSGRRPLASDGRLAVAGDGRRVRIEEGGALRVELAGHGDDVIAADLGPSGRLLTAAADGSVGSWQLARSSARLLGPVGHGITAAFSPDGRLVAAESLSRAEDGAEVERARGCMAGEGVWGGRFVRARFAADGSRFIAFHYRATVCSAAGALLAHDLGRSEVHAVALGPDGKLAVTGEQDHAANIWDAGTGRHLAELSPQAGPVVDVAVSPSGRVVATASGAEVGLWTAAGKHVATLSGHEGLVQAIAFSPDGRMLASVSGDRTARLWSVAEPERPPRVLRDHGDALVAASFSGDGKRLVVCGYDHRATVWGVPTGELHARLEGPEGHAGPVLGCLLARAGERAFTSSTDGTVKIWDVEGGRILTTLPSQGGPVISMDLSADGRRLVTANPAEDDCSTAPGAGRPRLWDVGPDAGHLGAPQEAQPTPDEVARRVSELVPWRLRGGRLVPAEVLPAGGDARVER